MNAIISVFETLQNQILAEKGYKFSHTFDLSLTLYHKNLILKNSKNVDAATCRPVALKTN
jgi:hypothetical protein